jgi:signal transduction histidine kinase
MMTNLLLINRDVDWGLRFVNKIVEELGGEIHLKSQPGVGTKIMFWIY